MLAAVWDFTKRHKGKIIAGGILVGSAAAYALSANDKKVLEKKHISTDLPRQARRHYIFDSTHRSCDTSITDLIPSLTTQIEARFDTEKIQQELMADEELSSYHKIELWTKLKINTFAKIVAVAYGFSILTLTLKAQISILAADTCAQYEKRTQKPSWQQYLPESVGSFLAKENDLAAENSMDVGNRRIFLQCVQFFTLKGFAYLMAEIEKAVSEELKDWSLSDPRSKEEARDLFDKIGTRLNIQGSLIKYVAPVGADEPDSSVTELLQKLIDNLRSTKSIDILNSLLDFYFSASLKMVDQEHQQQLAKLIPAIDAAYPMLTSRAFDSPLFNSLYSSDIHQFAVHVFNS